METINANAIKISQISVSEMRDIMPIIIKINHRFSSALILDSRSKNKNKTSFPISNQNNKAAFLI